MESIIDLIFDNPFLLIVVIAGIVGFFRDQKRKQEKEVAPKPVEPTPYPSGPVKAERYEKDYDEIYEEQEIYEQEHSSTRSLADLRKEQLERLKRETVSLNQSMQEAHVKKTRKKLQNTSQSTTTMPEVSKNHMKERLTERGLVDSIILTEVLGAPRALRPYESRIRSRKRI